MNFKGLCGILKTAITTDIKMDNKTFLSMLPLILGAVAVIVSLIRSLSSCSAPSFEIDRYVYVTPYGEKYHYSTCYYIDDADYLSKYDNYIEAEEYGYDSCSHCQGGNHKIMTLIDIKIDNK